MLLCMFDECWTDQVRSAAGSSERWSIPIGTQTTDGMQPRGRCEQIFLRFCKVSARGKRSRGLGENVTAYWLCYGRAETGASNRPRPNAWCGIRQPHGCWMQDASHERAHIPSPLSTHDSPVYHRPDVQHPTCSRSVMELNSALDGTKTHFRPTFWMLQQLPRAFWWSLSPLRASLLHLVAALRCSFSCTFTEEA